jgi:hypothetical protein
MRTLSHRELEAEVLKLRKDLQLLFKIVCHSRRLVAYLEWTRNSDSNVWKYSPTHNGPTNVGPMNVKITAPALFTDSNIDRVANLKIGDEAI